MRWNEHTHTHSASDICSINGCLLECKRRRENESKKKEENILNSFKTGQEFFERIAYVRTLYCSLPDVPVRVFVIYFITAICIEVIFHFSSIVRLLSP